MSKGTRDWRRGGQTGGRERGRKGGEMERKKREGSQQKEGGRERGKEGRQWRMVVAYFDADRVGGKMWRGK